MLQTIKTIKTPAEFKHKEKKSVFIGRAYPAVSPTAADEILEILRKEYYDARHICYAYSLADGTVKFSDDGEPGGTAGVRILNAINNFELNNIVVAVVRYFGGVKLGAGPLGKAYFTSAFETLSLAEIVEKHTFGEVVVSFHYEETSRVYRLLELYNAKNVRTHPEEIPKLSFYLKISDLTAFKDQLQQITAGKADFSVIKENILL